MIEIVFDTVENIVGKGERWQPAFSPFPTIFSTGFLKAVETRAFVVKVQMISCVSFYSTWDKFSLFGVLRRVNSV